MNTIVDRSILFSILLTFCAIVSCIFSNNPILPLSFTALGTIYLIRSLTQRYGSFLSISTLFVTFSLVYAVSGPITVITTGELIPPFSGPYNINKYLLLHNLGILGLIISQLVLRGKFFDVTANSIESMGSAATLLKPSVLVLATFSNIFEIINFTRASGFTLLSQGKSAYQGAVSDISFTLPASVFAVAAFSLVGIITGRLIIDRKGKEAVKLFIYTLLLSGFEVFVNLILGQRLEIFSYIIAFIMGYTTYNSIKRIKIKHVLITLCVYSSSVALYSYRWLLPQLLTSSSYIHANYDEINREMIDSLNPGKSEFGAPFGNFTTYDNLLDYPIKLGETYIAGATVAIPSSLYPGQKPLDITYIFRNDAALGNVNSSISGTGFSSLLESLINFSILGPLLIYFIIGYILHLLESIRHSNNMFFVIIYAFVSPLAMTFHRSGSGNTLSFVSWLPLILITVYLSVRIFTRSHYIKGTYGSFPIQ